MKLSLLNEPALKCIGLGKRYGAQWALRGVDLMVEPGESVAILGANGAGKTTLLRCALDFAAPTEGEAQLFGHSSRTTVARRHVGFVPERFLPPQSMTGHEVLVWLFGLRERAWSYDQSQAVFERYAITHEALDRPLSGFSKGMTQKLGLASAVELAAPLTMLDEPMSGLDPLAREALADALGQIRQSGRALVFTSHSVHDAVRIASRMVIIDRGRVLFDGDERALLKAAGCEDPHAAFVQLLQRSGMAAAA